MKPVAARANRLALIGLLGFACSTPWAWALDGARIVFAGAGAGGTSNIYVTTLDGGELEQLTFQDGGQSGWSSDPAWSPDGRQIAFSSNRNWVGQRIYVMDADAGAQRLISDGEDNGNYDGFPTWSPRGNAVAFSSTRWPNAHGVYVTDVQGGPDTRLTDLDTYAFRPSWRPVGNAIAYSSSRTGGHAIHFMDGRGRHTGQLPDHVGGGSAAWHPRENAIAFMKSDVEGAMPDIYTINTDGSDERRITKHLAWDGNPCWSPDGTQIVFESTRDDSQGLFIMDLDGRIVQKVTDERIASVNGASWFDPDVPRSVSPIGRRTTTWGWLKRLGAPAR